MVRGVTKIRMMKDSKHGIDGKELCSFEIYSSGDT
jgi:hypothetical protein